MNVLCNYKITIRDYIHGLPKQFVIAHS